MRILDYLGENSSLFSDMKDILFYMNNLAKIPLTSLNKLEFSHYKSKILIKQHIYWVTRENFCDQNFCPMGLT